MKRRLDQDDVPGKSPLRKKSRTVQSSVGTNALPVQDNETERPVCRRQESSADSRRSSIGYMNDLNSDQLQQKCLECVQLNIDNKISMKNAFSVPAIDVLAHFVKGNSSPNWQIASSTLDVSSKVYAMRVDKLYMDVNRMCSNMGLKNIGNDDLEEPLNEEQDEQNRNPEQAQKKQKNRAKRRKVLSTVEALRGNVGAVSLDALMSTREDPQTSDFLNQAQTVFSTTDGCQMKNFSGPVLDDLEGLTAGKGVFPNAISEHLSSAICQPLSFPFSFLDCNCDSDSGAELSFDQDVDVDHVDRQQQDVFHFDIDEVADPTPFPSQDVAVEVLRRASEPASLVVDLQDTITSQITQRESEYSFVSSDLISFSTPNFWKIPKQRSTVLVNKERCRRANGNVIAPDYSKWDTELNDKFSSRNRTMILKSTQNSSPYWTEENNTTYNYCHEVFGLELFHGFTQKDRLFKKVKRSSVNEPNVVSEMSRGTEDNFAAMDDMGFHNRTFDETPMEHITEHATTGENEIEQLPTSREQLVGDKLVSAPHVVDENNVFIPYSKRAKKINVRQLKQSMMKSIDEKSVATNEGDASSCKFSEVYRDLPRFLSRSNAKAMSAPIAFVSLLHLANEKNLAIEPTESFEDVTIRKDAKE